MNRLRSFQLWIYGSLLLSLVVPRKTYALQPLSDFLEHAPVRSTEYREMALTASKKEADKFAAYGELLPSISLTGSNTRNQYESAILLDPASGTKELIEPINSRTGSAQVSMLLIDIALWNRIASATHAANAASRAANNGLAEVQHQAAHAYYQLINAEAQRNAYQKASESAIKNLAVVRSKQSEGAATDLDVARAKVDVENENQKILDQELNSEVARRTLETLTGVTPSGDISKDSVSLEPEPELALWENSALAHNQSLMAAVEKSKQDRSDRNAASTALLPSLSAGFTQQSSNTAGFNGHNTYHNVAATLTWRLYAPTAINVKSHALAVKVSEMSVLRTRETLLNSIHEAWYRVRTDLARCRAARSQVVAARLAVQIANERYAADACTQLDLIQAQRDQIAAETSSIDADADLCYARVVLRLFAGLPAEGSMP